MPLVQARVRYTNGNGKVVTRDSLSLNVTKAVESALDKKDLMSDKLILISGIPSDRFYFVAGDKLLIRKYSSPEVFSSVIDITKTGWYAYNEFAPAGMKTADYQKEGFGFGYYIEPTEYTGDRYYGGNVVSLMRISSIKFCSRFIHCGSPLVPSDVYDLRSSVIMWGEVDANGLHALKIPAHLEDMSGLFDSAMSIDELLMGGDVPKIITLGQPKKMHRTFHSAFAYGMFTYEVPAGKTVFGDMDVSKVTDFSYCFFDCMQVNPDIEFWNTASAINMNYMFGIGVDWTTDKWSRDLSLWCVPLIPSEPTGFAQHHPMTAAQKPVWGTCPVNVRSLASGTYTTQTGDQPTGNFTDTNTRYWRFTLSSIKAGTVLTLKAGPHGTPRNGYFTDYTVIKAGGAKDSSNGVKTRMYGDGVPDKTIELTFTEDVKGPVEFIIGVSIYNYIYQMDKYATWCNLYLDAGSQHIVTQVVNLRW